MRLTLRTLLAYRDGVLEPSANAVLEAKIKESTTAQKISQRIEEEMRNRKLAPIPIDAREFGFDANMVAEYLDDTIPLETLPEMERKCLENNNLLSEVGSCHQILSRALSVPAPISSQLRQRIRELPSNPSVPSSLLTSKTLESNGHIRRIDAAVPMNQPNGSVAVDSASSAPTLKNIRKPRIELRGTGIELDDGLGRQVPEYLIGNDRGWLVRALLGITLVLSLVVVGAIAVGPMERVRDLLRNAGGSSPVKATPKGSEPTPAVEAAVVPRTEAEDETDLEGEPIMESSAIPPPVPSASAESPKVVVNKEPSESKNGSLPSVNPRAEANTNRSVGRSMQWLPETKESRDSLVFVLDTGALAQTDHRWQLLKPGDKVASGKRVVVPPAQRTEIRVEPGLRWLCAGDNDLQLASEGQVATVACRTGRAHIFATPDATEIDVDCNGTLLSIRFGSADSSCMLEVQNAWLPTSEEKLQAGDFELETSIRLIGVQGTLEYSSKGSKDRTASGKLKVGQFVDWKNRGVTEQQELSELPWWSYTSFERPIDQLAAKDLLSLTAVDAADLDSKLLALTFHKQGEIASLAARTRMMLGKYDGLFQSDGVFNRKGLHIHWQSILRQIPLSLGRTENRVALVNAVRQDAGNRANTLFELLVPKSGEQLSSGADKLLVESLSSPTMDERILAISQLSNITGKSLGFHAEKNNDKNSVDAIVQWRKLLGKSEIRYPESKISTLENE